MNRVYGALGRCGLSLWNERGLVLLTVVFMYVMSSLDRPPGVTGGQDGSATITAEQLGALIRYKSKPLLLTLWVCTMGLAIACSSFSLNTPLLQHVKVLLRTGMVIVLVFMGGVYCTTWVYTVSIAQDSVIMLSKPTESPAIPSK